MLKESLAYFDKGLAVHWLHAKSKKPIHNNWAKRPLDSRKELKDQYKDGMNVGVRLGHKLTTGFLCAIDCDVKSTDKKHLTEMTTALNELTQGAALPIVRSGRGNGSQHLYFLSDEPLKPFRYTQSNDKVKVFMPSVKASPNDIKTLGQSVTDKGFRLRAAWEISIMGVGQQIVLPPSVHPDSGKPYKWLNDLKHLKHLSITSPNGNDEKKEMINDLKFEPVELYTSSLSTKMVGMITEGTDVDDRSAALMSASIAMSAAGFTDNQILSVLTDPENYLSEVGYDHTKSKSRKRAAEWIYKHTVIKARATQSMENSFEDEVEYTKLDEVSARAQIKKLETARPWKHKLKRNPQTGVATSTFQNIKLILENVVGHEMVKHNEFSVEDHWSKDTPWGGKSGRPVKDVDIINIKAWLANHYEMEPSKDRIDEVIMHLADSNKYHPVRDYLDTLEWDGKPRVAKWLKTYLGAHGQPDEYLEAIGTKVLVAMVARVMRPGVKFDNVLILEGVQGTGKSTTAAVLAGDKWFSDSEVNTGDKDAVMNLQGVWVYEMGELSAMNRSEIESMKAFISRPTDRIRPPYGKRTLEYPRQNIFIGTTNNEEYLKDQSGNRRYWPCKTLKIHLKLLRRDRDQLLAEAVVMYGLGEPIFFEMDDPLLKVVETEQHKRVEVDELKFQILELLEQDELTFDKECFRIQDIFESGAGFARGLKDDQRNKMRMANALKNLGYKKEQKRSGKVKGYWWSKVSAPTSKKGKDTGKDTNL